MTIINFSLFIIILLRIYILGLKNIPVLNALKRCLWLVGIYLCIAAIEYIFYDVGILDSSGMAIKLKYFILIVACTLIITIEELPDEKKSDVQSAET